MNQQPATGDSLVLSYLGLRKVIGIIGMALPFVLAFGKMLLDSPGIQSSVSAYYYTVMRDVFVGSMCAMAMFLMSYRGYERQDARAGKLACFFALGLALFPVAPEINATQHARLVGALHLTFAASFFLTLAYFCLVLFRKSNPAKTPTPRKLQRNTVYTVCGYAILACLALIVGVKWLPADSPLHRIDPVFWLESVAIVSFGLSWFTKGEAILKDVEV